VVFSLGVGPVAALVEDWMLVLLWLSGLGM
jgi:hypothetical protein